MEGLRREPGRLDEVFATLRERVAARALPAAALAVGDAAGEIRAEAFGERGRPINRATNFFLASITKPIFATAFMQLVEDGLVDLHEPIGRHVPGFDAGEKTAVTAWHVLTHTSGVADVAADQLVRRRLSAAEMTRLVVEAPLRFTPGTRWEYCSASFYLLAAVIERVSGIRYARFLDERLVRPLGMATTFDPRRTGRPIVAVHGAGVDNRLVRFLVLRYLAGAALPGGGLFGSMGDLVRFGAATIAPVRHGERLLPLRPSTIEEMARDQTRGLTGVFDGEERPVHFGLGWGKPTLMRDVPGSPRVLSHGGVSGGRLWLDPEIGLVLVFLTNRWSADRGPEIEAIRGVYGAIDGG